MTRAKENAGCFNKVTYDGSNSSRERQQIQTMSSDSLHLFTIPFSNNHPSWSPEFSGTFLWALLHITHKVLSRKCCRLCTRVWTCFEAACMCQCGTPFKVSKSRVKERWWWWATVPFLSLSPHAVDGHDLCKHSLFLMHTTREQCALVSDVAIQTLESFV